MRGNMWVFEPLGFGVMEEGGMLVTLAALGKMNSYEVQRCLPASCNLRTQNSGEGYPAKRQQSGELRARTGIRRAERSFLISHTRTSET